MSNPCKEYIECGDIVPGVTFTERWPAERQPHPGEGRRWKVNRLAVEGEPCTDYFGKPSAVNDNRRKNKYFCEPINGGDEMLFCFDQMFDPKKFDMEFPG